MAPRCELTGCRHRDPISSGLARGRLVASSTHRREGSMAVKHV